MSKSFEDLADKRRKWVEINKENNFDEGIKRLLTELYPDNAHFIYELLQNAEDTQASKVRFLLKDESIEFEHNGLRSFSLSDVESITSIGASTKGDDHTSIGKFGVGFKAVFAYTSTPEIISDTYHFIIRDLVVPEIQDSQDSQDSQDKIITNTQNITKFIFPFNNSSKTPRRAVDEVQRGLNELRDNSLLFLTHIREIHYAFPDGSEGSLQRSDLDNGKIKITSVHPKQRKTTSHWLRFTKEVKVESEEKKENNLVISVAYALEQVNKKTKQGIQKDWAIMSCNPGQVSIFFPAEKETSKLRFHLHAPFASTVARDSIRDCSENDVLRDHLAELVVESLFRIRDKGLLTTRFLSVLPNPSEELSHFYEPIRQRIVDAFNVSDLVPTRSGNHAPASMLCIGPAKIASLIGDNDLSFFSNESYRWAANPQQRNQREDRFLGSLNLQPWEWSDLSDVFIYFDEVRKLQLEKWLALKSDSFLLQLYALLWDAYEETYELPSDELKIVRVVKKDDEMVYSYQAFFEPSDEIPPPLDHYFIKKSIYEKGTKKQIESAKNFLVEIGVKELSIDEITKINLQSYNEVKKTRDDQHYLDIQGFVNFYKKKPEEASIFNDKMFIYGISSSGKKFWCAPGKVFIDDPYMKTGLSSLCHIHERYSLCKSYSEKLPLSLQNDFIELLIKIGVMTSLKIDKASMYFNKNKSYLMIDMLTGANETAHAIKIDYSIQSITEYINENSIEASRLLWNVLIKADSSWSTAKYRPNSRYITREADSQFVYHLKVNSWIPDKQGVFHKPADITKEQLREDFNYNNENGLLTAIKFGEKAKLQSEESKEKDEAAKKLGFELKDIEQLKMLKEAGLSDNAIQDFINSQTEDKMPEASVPNPERRRKGIIEQSSNARYKESEIRERTVQKNTHEETVKAKAYLRARYKNNEDQVICQCCHKEMPFKVKGEHYFEAVQCLRQLDRHHSQNRLALCPVCSAMYRHALETEHEEIKKTIIKYEASDDISSAKITIKMAGEEYQLYFVGVHWFDLKELLKS